MTSGSEWASAAEDYAAALNDAYAVGITDAMRFYAPDAHVDKRFINYEGVGRAGFAQALRDNAQNPPPSTPTGSWRNPRRSTTLHELGHVWMSAPGRGGPVPPEVTERFTEQAGQPTWADTAYVWQDRGVELAASTIAWALTDEPVVHPQFADRFRCSELGELFTTLTGKPVPESAGCPG